jgi:arylsulfatase A-like enzyme
MAEFKTMARALDLKMATVFAALEASGKADNTLVICTTDHGIAFPRMKCNLHDSGTGVMLILRGPGGFTGGKVCDGMVSHIDIFPTICDVTGIEKPAWLEGNSIIPWANGKAEKIRDEVFAEVNFHAATEPMRSVRTGRYKYIKRYDGLKHPVLPNCDDGYAKSVWTDNGWSGTAPDAEMLYDLTFDPNETNNLVAKPEMKDVLAEMRSKVRNWMEKTGDPLLSGSLEIPKGAMLNKVDAYSPASIEDDIVTEGGVWTVPE